MNDDIHFLDSLQRLRPTEAEAAGALAISYQAGRRDGAAASGGTVMRWRAAAGVLLAATLGLSAALAGDRWMRQDPPAAVTQTSQPPEAQPGADRWAAPAEVLRPLPGSYASMRSAGLTGEDLDLDRVPGGELGGPGGFPGERPMTAREAM